MIPPAVRWLLIVALGVIVLGVAALARLIVVYLANPRAISSTAGLPVFRLGEGYVSYSPFEMTIEPTIIGVGVALFAAGALIAAAVWQPRA